MDLYAGRRIFSWTAIGWSVVLRLAFEHGWEPTGTGSPKGTLQMDWCGSYSANDGQLFYARDAKRLAAALERAFDSTTTPQRQNKKKMPTFYEPALKRLVAALGGSSDATTAQTVAWLSSTDGRKKINDFIAFCRKGSFRIQ